MAIIHVLLPGRQWAVLSWEPRVLAPFAFPAWGQQGTVVGAGSRGQGPCALPLGREGLLLSTTSSSCEIRGVCTHSPEWTGLLDTALPRGAGRGLWGVQPKASTSSRGGGCRRGRSGL